MSHQIVLFHSGLGLRPAVLHFAERLRAEGHTVYTPDLFDGEVFDSMEEGERKRDTLGIPELMSRAETAAAEHSGASVFAGFSMGAAAAQYLAATSPSVRAAILMHGALPPAAIGLEVWPRDVPVQVHYGEQDTSVDSQDIDTFAEMVRHSGALVDVHSYPKAAHLFSDDGFEEYDPASATVMFDRMVGFLATL